MPKHSQETIDRIRSLYAVIVNSQLGNDSESVNIRVNIIRELERLTGQNFNNTEDFHRKINEFLLRASANKSNAERLQNARKSLGLTQKQLAETLGVSERIIQHWENGTREVSKRGLNWLNSQNGPTEETRTKIEFRDQSSGVGKNRQKQQGKPEHNFGTSRT